MVINAENRKAYMFVLVKLVVRNNTKKNKKLSSLNKLMSYRNTWKYLLVWFGFMAYQPL